MKLREVMIKSNNNSVNYLGKMSDYQTKGSKRGKVFVKPQYNEYQNLLYKRALFGLKVYDEDELVNMNKDKKKRISKVNKRAQNSINLFKQEKANILADQVFKLFFHSKLASDIMKNNSLDAKFTNELDLKSLNIKKKDIVERLLKEGILPPNFKDLKTA